MFCHVLLTNCWTMLSRSVCFEIRKQLSLHPIRMSYQHDNLRRAKRRYQNNDPSLSSAYLTTQTAPHPTNIRPADGISDLEMSLESSAPSAQTPYTPETGVTSSPRTC